MRGFVVLLSLAACSNNTSGGHLGSGYGQCAERGGTYRTDWIEHSGTCGPVDSSIDTVDKQPPAGPLDGCRGPGVGYTSDNCEVTNKYICPANRGYFISMDGLFKWSTDGALGEGEAHVMMLDGDRIVCESDYTIRVTRQ